jgi:hypothetical protein
VTPLSSVTEMSDLSLFDSLTSCSILFLRGLYLCRLKSNKASLKLLTEINADLTDTLRKARPAVLYSALQ